jgi:hypothetical protein
LANLRRSAIKPAIAMTSNSHVLPFSGTDGGNWIGAGATPAHADPARAKVAVIATIVLPRFRIFMCLVVLAICAVDLFR